MERIGGLGFSDASSAVRKKRSNTSRRPRNDSQQLSDYRDVSSLSSTPPSDNNMIKNEDGSLGESDEASNSGSYGGSNEQRPSGVSSRRSSEGVLAPANWKGTNMSGYSGLGVAPEGLGNENKVKKVKLKVVGVTRTIDANSASDGASAVGSYATKSSRISEGPPRRKFIIQEEILDDNPSFTTEKAGGLQGVPWKDFARSAASVGRVESSQAGLPGDKTFTKQIDNYEPVRKSKRVPKKRLLDGVLDDGVDDKIQYLEKVNASNVVIDYDVEYKDEYDRASRKQRKRNIGGLYDVGDYGQSVLGKEGKNSRSVRASDDVDYLEEEEPVSDGETETRRKKPKKEFIDSLGDPKREMTVTTRQRALQTGTDVSPGLGASIIEFPNGLPPAPKKQKEKLSEVEQQLKRAEALQRRRMQVEKAARESEAEAIRKILGQDSSRKKKEDKIKKRQEELAQEKAANAMMLKSDSVRWVMGPSGTIVTFPSEVGLPSIFDPKPCSYPPPREKCAGPSCTNPYKYRDSKSKLPLCSLQCYKAVHEKMKPVSAC
ncbi:hypothetical protein HS088_TW11G00044 [Tripterygium wilfordii]|uniref:INO80 complex subunit B-like conserved region domain-containing protein n=1 Tax=Tripterygium wilfordii TaxID=458696 RepID=A0A7J7D0X4_TRIWF|nr:uncharacterized protein LOC120008559 [Tripterygium wilfordii]KAF5739981.1 hypothetical protein HS088_TW11G00044 [Tripterygium wilfordii]